MSKYIGNIPVPNATQTRTRIVATSEQTSFTTSDEYTPGYIDVFLGGVKLDSSEFTATDGTTVVLASGANTGQIFESISYTTFSAAISNATEASGAFKLTNYTTAERDALTGIEAGDIIYNTTLSSTQFYNGTVWVTTIQPPTLTSISGSIIEGAASSLSLSGTNFLESNLVVNFLQASDSIDVDVTVTPTSNTSATVTVPSSVYDSVTGGNVVSIKVTNFNGSESNTVTTTAIEAVTGGTVTSSGGYTIHTFTSSGTFTVPTGQTLSDVEYIVVAGGASGGEYGGGGGAGGYRSSVVGESSGGGAVPEARISMPAASYTVTVGAGGAAQGTGSYLSGNSGVASSIIGGAVSISSVGGGGGGGYEGGLPATGNSGGSGGGAGTTEGSTARSGGSGTSGQGYNGGNAIIGRQNTGLYPGAAGGGGAGAVGANGSGKGGSGSDGGIGVQSSIDGTATYRAGGGGGYAPSTTALGGSGGLGGGGDAGDHTTHPSAGPGSPGTANTGGGGGAAFGGTSGSYDTGAGGSGVVIIRYTL
jgi:hypothetical protein